MKLTIPRKIWLRGEGDARSRLLRIGDGKMCCIGIYLKELGVPEEYLADVADASSFNLNQPLPEEAKWLRNPCIAPSAGRFYTTNDYELPGDGYIASEEDREAKIKEMFEAHGVELEFI